MKVNPEINPFKKAMTFNVTSTLLDHYFDNFRGMICDNSDIPGVDVYQEKPGTATISIPMMMNEISDGVISGGINTKAVISVDNTIQSFLSAAMRKEERFNEFVPLHNYPEDKLIVEIADAVKNKRNLCIIKDFKEYQKNLKDRTYEFEQYRIDYGTVEYANAVLMIRFNNFDELRKTFEPKLKLTKWY